MKVKYKNWKSSVRIRDITPLDLWFGRTKYHIGEQWFIKAIDLEDGEAKDFALKDCDFRNVE